MTRVPVPSEVASEILFASDRTCCVCNERGRPVQIHHIDANPGNNNVTNLAVLCLLCHEETQRRGSFARTLDAATVERYREDWHARVAARRRRADELATVGAATPGARTTAITGRRKKGLSEEGDESLMAYAWRLPTILARSYSNAQPRWDSGITAEMIQASYDVIEVLGNILQNLSQWYPPDHFADLSADDYFSNLISARFTWHRAIAEPEGPGTGGTIVGPIASAAVLSDLEAAVDEMISALLFDRDGFDLREWRKKWSAASSPSSSFDLEMGPEM